MNNEAKLVTLILCGSLSCRGGTAPAAPTPGAAAATALTLGAAEASHFAGLALRCVGREYPNKPEHVVNDAVDVKSPRQLHPAFYGCFDWHSSVHGHWMLVRLLRLFPALPEAPAIRAALEANLTPASLLAEKAYFAAPNRQSFERTYGWAWLLKLDEELARWDDPDGRRWSQALRPLSETIVARYLDFLPKQRYPIRTGVHPNTAFGLALAYDYATRAGDGRLRELVRERSLAYFGEDAAYPAAWEPGGEDFLSPALVEADLMRRVLGADAFARWLRRFLPELDAGGPRSLMTPAVVTDRTDPKLVHLDGLNLSRAWCMRAIAAALPPGDAAAARLEAAAREHAAASLPYIASGDYGGEHWLATFAVYMMTDRDGGGVAEARAESTR